MMYFRTFIHFGKKLLWFYKKFSETTCSSFWWTTYLLSLVDVFFNRQSAWLWVQPVLLFSPTCYFFSYEAVIIQELLQKNEKKRNRSFNFKFHYIDDVRSLNNSRFGVFVDRLYPFELQINDTTYTDRSASYLDLHLNIDNKGRLRTDTLLQKRWFQFSHWELSIYM